MPSLLLSTSESKAKQFLIVSKWTFPVLSGHHLKNDHWHSPAMNQRLAASEILLGKRSSWYLNYQMNFQENLGQVNPLLQVICVERRKNVVKPETFLKQNPVEPGIVQTELLGTIWQGWFSFSKIHDLSHLKMTSYNCDKKFHFAIRASPRNKVAKSAISLSKI